MEHLVVASHNQMRVRELARLVEHYRGLRRRDGLDILCLQESVDVCGDPHGRAIAAGLGADFCVIDDHAREAEQVMVYDSSRVQLAELRLLELPRLSRLSLLQRWVLGQREPLQRHAQLASFRVVATQRRFTVVNFHLDCVGALDHRRAQVARLRRELERLRWPGNIVACGDTNAFALRRQLSALAWVLAPLGFADVGRRPTHWFARAREEALSHRMAVALGRVGIDLPHRYDVVCANAEVRAHGQVSTPESDHDLVWASVVA
jgi:endonuclease/exonuclease/phosphatase family metal-dependent hydrolase